MKKNIEDKPPILEHEILRILYRLSAHIMKHGNAETGYIPIYKKDYKYGYLDYSYLVDQLNNPEKYKTLPENHAHLYYQNLRVKDHEIKTDKYSYEEISKALAILEFCRYIKEDEKIVSIEMEYRTIHLTRKGELAFLKEYYIEERKKYKEEDDLQKSIIDLNNDTKKYYEKQEEVNESIKWLNFETNNYYSQLKWATWVIAGATIISLVLGLFNLHELYLQRTAIKPTLDTESLQLLQESLKSQKGIQSSLSIMAKDTFVLKGSHLK